jgi:hypothetical protein
VSSTAGRKLRGTRRLALASACVLVVGLLATAAGFAVARGAGGTHAVLLDVSYSCTLSSATYPVSVEVAASFPESVTAGQPVQPTGLQLTFELPQAAVAHLRSAGASTVSAQASLTAVATFGGTPVPAQWPAQTAAADSLPDTGGLTLTTSGTAQPATAKAPGTITFAVSGLALDLTPATSAGAATAPATVGLTCQPGSGASVQLASVTVSGATSSPSASATSPKKPANANAKTKAKAKAKDPKGCGDIKVTGTGVAVCGYLRGYSDVLKLYGATRLGPVLVNIDFAYKHVFKKGNLIEYSKAELYYKGKHELPPVRATFLGFRFVPVTATLSLVERAPVNIVSISGLAPPYPIKVTATTRIAIHVSDVTVNGQPLDVGSGCRAAYSAKFTLVGHGTNTFPPTGYTVPTGGPLAGFLTIPPFVHCGVTQNLDPLLTGSISGPGNYTKLTQGKLCGPLQPANWTCPPPPVRKPLR